MCKENDADMNRPVQILSGGSLPAIPWQERPSGDRHDAPVWRFSGNPIIGRNPAPGVARVFNSAVAPFENGFIAWRRESCNRTLRTS